MIVIAFLQCRLPALCAVPDGNARALQGEVKVFHTFSPPILGSLDRHLRALPSRWPARLFQFGRQAGSECGLASG